MAREMNRVREERGIEIVSEFALMTKPDLDGL
jgi:hypothetical protein